PYTFRRISRDHALTEIYSYICEEITREPGWHAHYFGLSDDEARENAEATVFLEALLFRRYTAKLEFELEFWSQFEQADVTTDERGSRRAARLRAARHASARGRTDGYDVAARRHGSAVYAALRLAPCTMCGVRGKEPHSPPPSSSCCQLDPHTIRHLSAARVG